MQVGKFITKKTQILVDREGKRTEERMNHPDTFALLNKLGLVNRTTGPDGKESVIDPPHEVIHKLMNLTLHCLGALRNLVS